MNDLEVSADILIKALTNYKTTFINSETKITFNIFDYLNAKVAKIL